MIDEGVRENMAEVLMIQSGEFAREWIVENQVGRPVFNRLHELEKGTPHRGSWAGTALDDPLIKKEQ